MYEKDGDIKILMDGEHMHPKGMIFGSAMQNDESKKFFADISEDGETVSGYPINELLFMKNVECVCSNIQNKHLVRRCT